MATRCVSIFRTNFSFFIYFFYGFCFFVAVVVVVVGFIVCFIFVGIVVCYGWLLLHQRAEL